MPNLNELIKQIAVNTYNSMSPPELTVGKVESTEPLEIRVDEKLKLNASCLIVLESAGELAADDSVIMLRVAKGQKYIVLGRTI